VGNAVLQPLLTLSALSTESSQQKLYFSIIRRPCVDLTRGALR